MIWVVSKLQLWVGKKSWGWNHLGFLNWSFKPGGQCCPAQQGLLGASSLICWSGLDQGVAVHLCPTPSEPLYLSLYYPFSQQGRGSWLGCVCCWRAFIWAALYSLPWSPRGFTFCRLEGQRLIDQISILSTWNPVEHELCFMTWVHLTSSQTKKFSWESTKNYL